MDVLLPNIVSAVVFTVLGLVLFAAAFWIVDKLTPGHLWHQLCEARSTPLAIFLGSVMLGLAIIVAAAVN